MPPLSLKVRVDVLYPHVAGAKDPWIADMCCDAMSRCLTNRIMHAHGRSLEKTVVVFLSGVKLSLRH